MVISANSAGCLYRGACGLLCSGDLDRCCQPAIDRAKLSPPFSELLKPLLIDSFSSIQLARLDASGAPLGVPRQVNAYTTGPQTAPTVATGPGSDFIVAWSGEGGVRARRFEQVSPLRNAIDTFGVDANSWDLQGIWPGDHDESEHRTSPPTR